MFFLSHSALSIQPLSISLYNHPAPPHTIILFQDVTNLPHSAPFGNVIVYIDLDQQLQLFLDTTSFEKERNLCLKHFKPNFLQSLSNHPHFFNAKSKKEDNNLTLKRRKFDSLVASISIILHDFSQFWTKISQLQFCF